MRIQSKFGITESSLTPRIIKSKYYLAYEGTETERIYFEGIIKNREKIGITPLIELIPLYRNFPETGRSHPKRILNDVIDFFLTNNGNDKKFTPTLFLDLVFSYLDDNNLIKSSSWQIKNMLYQSLKEFINTKIELRDEYIIDIDEATSKIIDFLKQEESIIAKINMLHHYLEEQSSIVYDSAIDVVCFVLDRDEQNFKPDQYDFIMSECIERKYKLYISNPTFEFWLLLHFKEALDYDRTLLLKNPKKTVKSKTRYLETLLNNLLSGYKKGKYDVNVLIEKIELAIEQEKEFCEDLHALKDDLGTNIGTLLSELLDYHQK